MATSAELLRQSIADYEPRLCAISGAAASANPRGGAAWSPKQELGHLIDSATNNRIRFVRATLEGAYDGPSYDGRGWVDLAGYADMPWPDVIALWQRLNLALAALLDRIPEARLSAPCIIASERSGTLDFVIQDYIRHMRHHLDHILASAA
jgi:hypothetical protein